MNVEELLNSKKIEFKASGNDFVVHCLNPEHEDNNPSMRIDRILGVFNCFSCGYRGNIFSFFDQEKDMLAIKREKLKRKIIKLRASSTGLTIPDGATPYVGSWRNISAKTYAAFGAFRHHSREFSGRLVFPIKNASGKIIAFIARDETGASPIKYIFYPKEVELQPYPAKPIPINGRIIVVEGIFDVLNLYDKGLTNATAIFGVNNFKEEHLTNFKIQGVSGLDLMLDADEAGKKGIANIRNLCEENNMPVRTVRLPEGQDPGALSEKSVSSLKSRLYE